MKLSRRGKVKDVYEVDGDTLEFHYSDRISVFDKVIPSDIPHKGETLCRTSAHWFNVAKTMGVRSHFVELPSNNRMRVNRLNIFEKLDKDSRNCIIPLEFIMRHYVSGSLFDRMKSGEVDPRSLGLKGENDFYGKKLPQPFFEVTTKFEEFDRKVDMEEAMDISGLGKDEFQAIEETIVKIDERIGKDVSGRGLIHVDGKKEFGLDDERNLLIVDSFGTADEDRFWDSKKYENGECIELSKEFVRQYYRNIEYYEELTRAREKGLEEPDIPPLSGDMVKQVSDLYIEMFERITGEVFR
jgi:phosphoribosylaminoimidazole-succinocarboxamide synthase